MRAEARSIITQMTSQIEQQSREQDRRSKQIEDTMDRLEKAIYAINVSGWHKRTHLCSWDICTDMLWAHKS